VRALIVEDEVKMANLLRRGLGEEGYVADVALDGERALTMARATEYDVILLDVMLPGIDGFEVCRRLRAASVWSPTLMLTARDAVDDRIAGLDAGADDYLMKPFSFAELLARLRALMRRGPIEKAPVLEVGSLRVDPRSHQVWRGDVEIPLSVKGFALLETLMRRPGHVVSRFDLLEHAWDYSFENRSNIVDVYIRYLRERIDRPFGIRSLETVRGAGYRLRSDGGVPVVRRAQRYRTRSKRTPGRSSRTAPTSGQ
jgi:two-component system OmpR family response regulator